MHVLISGAGVAGPALVWFLAKVGARITIVEKAQSLLAIGQNIDVNATALTVVRKMGLLHELKRFNTTEKGTQFIDSKGRSFAPFPVKADSTASPTSEFEILRGDLAMVFYNATKDLPNVDYLFGTTINKVVTNDHDSVKVELSNGQSREYALLVAADGQWSKVRRMCFPPEDVTTFDTGMYAVYCTIPRLPSDNDWWNVYIALGSRIVTLRPDPHGTIRATFTRTPSSHAEKKAWQEAARSDRQTQNVLLRKEYADAGWQSQRILDNMEDSPDFYFQACQQIRMTHWSTGRVVCLGDAAWAPTPLTGAGADLAINGAYVLAGELSKLEEGEHPAKALDAYEKTFKPWVEQTQDIPSIIPGIAHPGTAFKRWLFHAFISTLSRLATFSWLVKKLGFNPEAQDFPLPSYPRFDSIGSKATIVA